MRSELSIEPQTSGFETLGPTILKNIERFRKATGWEQFKEELERVMRAYYDVLDNFSASKPPRSHTLEKQDSEPESFERALQQFKEFYAPKELIKRIFEQFPQHGIYENHDVVGNREEGTGHGHRYILERFISEAAEEAVRIYFLDPEHHVGAKNFLRPAILNLMAMEVNEELSEFELRTLRVRTETIDESVLSNFSKLKHLAELLLKNNVTPDRLEALDIDPREVIYFASAASEAVSIMSRYVGENGIKAIHNNGLLPRFILGKILSHQGLLRRIIQKAAAGKYRSKESGADE